MQASNEEKALQAIGTASDMLQISSDFLREVPRILAPNSFKTYIKHIKAQIKYIEGQVKNNG